jgi:hypothetical protein
MGDEAHIRTNARLPSMFLAAILLDKIQRFLNILHGENSMNSDWAIRRLGRLGVVREEETSVEGPRFSEEVRLLNALEQRRTSGLHTFPTKNSRVEIASTTRINNWDPDAYFGVRVIGRLM